MSASMAKQARRDMRAKINRITSTPKGKVDASGWEPPEPLKAGRKVYDKAKERSATAKVYKHGGKVQGDRGPVNRGKKARGHKADGGVPSSRFTEGPVSGSALMNRGGRTGCEHMAKGGATRTGNRSGDGYVEGTRPTGGRIARAHGGPNYSKEAVDKEIRKDKRIGSKEASSIHRLLKGPTYKPVGAGMDDRVASDRGRLSGMLGGGGGQDDEMKRGGRTRRAHGGRAKGKTNIVINVGEKNAQPPMPPIQMPTRPPMPPAPPAGPPPGVSRRTPRRSGRSS